MVRTLIAGAAALLLCGPLLAGPPKVNAKNGLIHLQTPADPAWELLTTRDYANTIKFYTEKTRSGATPVYDNVDTVRMIDGSIYPVEFVTHDPASGARKLKANKGYVISSLPKDWKLLIGIPGAGTCTLGGTYANGKLQVTSSYLGLDGSEMHGSGPYLKITEGNPAGANKGTEFTITAR